MFLVAIIWLAFVFGTAALSGWAFMLAVGVAHSEWITTLPTIGFWPAYAIMALLTFAFSIGNAINSSRSND